MLHLNVQHFPFPVEASCKVKKMFWPQFSVLLRRFCRRYQQLIRAGLLDSVELSSVQFRNITYISRSLILKILWRLRLCILNAVLSWRTNCPTVSDVFFSFDGKLFHADGPAAEQIRAPP